MNLYFILEGTKTEMAVYPFWLNSFLPDFSRVYFEDEAISNNYYLFSGGGIPNTYNHTVNAIKNINDNPIYDRLIVCLDSEELTVDKRIEKVKEHIKNSKVLLNSRCKLDFVIQNVCIETWFLGNRKIVKKNPDNSELRNFQKHFDIIINDPEIMPKLDSYKNKAHFHLSYLKEVFKERNQIYLKSRPDVILHETYLSELIKRTSDTPHLSSLKSLFNLLNEIKCKL